MNYNFEEVIDRRNTNALNTDGYKNYIFKDANISLPFRDEEYIRMWVADMEFATPDFVLDAIKQRVDRQILGYSMVFDSAYYEAFAAWTQKMYGWKCEREHLVTSLGIIPALYDLVEYLTKPDEKVLVFTPSYAYFMHAVNRSKRTLVCSDLLNCDENYTMDWDDIRRQTADKKTTLCIFCNPHNPTGRVWTEKELQAFGEIMVENNMWVISDEIHCDLLRSGTIHTPLAKLFPNYTRLITCMSPSKTFNMAGMMFSNIVIPSAELRTLWNSRDDGLRNPLSIAGAQAAYEQGYDWLMQLRAYLDANFSFMSEYLSANLPKAKYQISQSTYLTWVDVNAYFSDITQVSLPLFFAEKAGVLLEGGNMFVQNSDGHIRLNLACPQSVLSEGLKRICETLNQII
jgi:cystathionine beta-lyase